MAGTIHVHPLALERIEPVISLIDDSVSVVVDDDIDPAIARVRIAPGSRASTLVQILLVLGSRVLFVWPDAAELADWLETEVAERRNLGPQTSKAAVAKAAGLTTEEAAALHGWSLATAEIHSRQADDLLALDDWGDLQTAASLRSRASENVPAEAQEEFAVEFERVASSAARTGTSS